MQLVKDIVKAITNGIRTESEIMMKVKGVKKDYGTTNNTLRRLCKHGVLVRGIGFNSKTNRYCYHYRFDMAQHEVADYIDKQEQKVRKHKFERLKRAGIIQPTQPIGFYIEVNDWQPADLIAKWIKDKGYPRDFSGTASDGSRYFFFEGDWGCMSADEQSCYHHGEVVNISDLKELSLREFIEDATLYYSPSKLGKAGQYFDFGDAIRITKNFDADICPLTIGDGIAPEGFERKCLLVNRAYHMEVVEHKGFTTLVFKKIAH